MKTILALSDISKQFPGVKALDHVSLEVYEGEVHALMGENGAGKSTLMKILAGLYQADSGTIFLAGEEVHFHNTFDAISHGISMVHQELMPVMERTVAENVFLGREPVFRNTNIVNRKKLLGDTRKILERMHLNIRANARMKDLSVAEIQLVEIAKAISLNPRIIIMDEPTSAISEQETENLFELIRALKAEGISIIYISHKLNEIFRITDRITILRDGVLIGTGNTEDMTEDQLITMMVGRELKDVFPESRGTGGYDDLEDAVEKMSKGDGAHYEPSAQNSAVYDELYREYDRLHDYFGRGENEVMKRLKAIAGKQRKKNEV